jgi:hypothetical protein
MKVWVLMALFSNGHLTYPAIPTLEFATEEKCNAAGVKMRKYYNEQRIGSFKGNCIEIEK